MRSPSNPREGISDVLDRGSIILVKYGMTTALHHQSAITETKE